MIIYHDKDSNDEVLSDTHKIERICGGEVLKVTAKLTTETTTVDDSMIGGNASAEGGDEQNEDASVSGINICLAHKLVEMGFKKSEFKKFIGSYMKKLKEDICDGEEQKSFMKEMSSFVKDELLANFDDYQFFVGESMNPDMMPVMVKWEGDDGSVPMMYYIKRGLIEEKV